MIPMKALCSMCGRLNGEMVLFYDPNVTYEDATLFYDLEDGQVHVVCKERRCMDMASVLGYKQEAELEHE